jgi:hypothetical protein
VTDRKRLPNRRYSESINFTWNDLLFVATFSRDPDNNRVVEIFLGNHKTGGAIDLIAKDSAIVCSIALQFGADFETIRLGLLRDSRDVPASPQGAAMDAIAKLETSPQKRD